MIVEWIWAQIAAFLGWLLHLFPTFTLPSWVDDLGDYAVQGVTMLNGLHNWVPLDAMRNSMVFLFACSTIAFSVRVFRIALSLFTGGGGGAT